MQHGRRLRAIYHGRLAPQACPPLKRMMGALEAMDGMLLFGISTAYIFGMMQAYWPMMTRRRSHSAVQAS